MNDESAKVSSDLIRWLKMLTLPVWAKITLAIVMLLILFCALGLLIWGLLQVKYELITSSVAMLTISLPVSLVVVALVFGDSGARKLKELTNLVLTHDVPSAILQNLASGSGKGQFTNCTVTPSLSGCIAHYAVSAEEVESGVHGKLKSCTFRFALELNVKKVNLIFWIPTTQETREADWNHRLSLYKSCFFGATKEGYVQNVTPVHDTKTNRTGIVFIKSLGEDFLLNPGQRLYFAQDLAFFIRGLLQVELDHG